MSKITEIGKIPEDWMFLHLNEIVKINPETIDRNYPHKEIEYIDIGSVENYEIKKYEYFRLSERPSRAQRIVRQNDIIVSTVRPYLHGFAKIRDSNPNLVCSTGFAVLRCSKPEGIDFIFNFIMSEYFESQLNKHMTGLAYPAVTSKIVGDTTLAYPKNKDELKSIGNILSKVDELIHKTDQIIEQTQILKKGLMQRLLTRGIEHTKFKKTEFGEIPEEWEIVKVTDICQGIVPGRNKPKEFNGNIPWITINDIDDMYVGKSKNALGVTRAEVKNCSAKIIPPNSVIMTCVGELGIIAITICEVVINQQLHAFVCSNRIIPYFLAIYLATRKQYMYSVATTTTIPYMNKENCNGIPVILPPKEEQEQIAKIISSLDIAYLKEKDEKCSLTHLKKALMQKLLTGKIRVEISTSTVSE